MSIKEKITSKERLVEIIGSNSYTVCERTLLEAMPRVSSIGMPTPKVQWWAIREAVRLAKTGPHSTYETTEALDVLNNCRQTFAHISQEDKSMVAFTPDAVFGAADKQLRISFGKLASRLLPFANDDYIRDLTAMHIAELSDEVEWVEGLDIAKEYSKDISVGACMSSKTFSVQPTVAYATPGVKMAVLRKPDGELMARAMVIEDKKVYIRAYGNPMLKRRLERLGYKVGTWGGTVFNTVYLHDKDANGLNAVVIPYLDANGGTCNSRDSSVALIDFKLTALTPKQQEKFSKHNLRSAVPSTVGYVMLSNVESSKFKVKSLLSDRMIDMLTDYTIDVATLDSEGKTVFGLAQEQEIIENSNYVSCRAFRNGDIVSVYAENSKTFEDSCRHYFDDAASREARGFRRLSEKFYPEKSWCKDYTMVVDITKSEESKYAVMASDAINFVKADGTVCALHKSQVSKDMVRLANIGKSKCYADKSVELLQTVSGTKVHKDLHSGLVKTYKGYDYTRNVKVHETILSTNVYVQRKGEVDKAALDDFMEKTYTSTFETRFKDVADSDIMFALREMCELGYHTRIFPRTENKHFTRTETLGSSELQRKVMSNKFFAGEFFEQMEQYVSGKKWKIRAVRDLKLMVLEALAEEPKVAVKPVKSFTAETDDKFALAA